MTDRPLPPAAPGDETLGDPSPAGGDAVPATDRTIGPYELRGELGRGGMGVVYRAWRPDLNREFALKVILAGADAGTETIERFRREARSAASLSEHPGIVGVHDIGEADGKVYFAMDLVEGAGLDDLIRRGDTAPEELARIFEECARALHFAHARGILHRDVKPSNVLLDSDGHARIADFGLAKSEEAGAESTKLTRSGQVLGTPAYMSPEQASGETLDARADVYALGASLYEALTGRPPFVADSTVGVIARIVTEEPEPPRRLRPETPRDLETISLRCLEKDPASRYATADALAADLARYRVGEPILARPIGRFERWRKRVRRNPAPYAIAGLALLALCVVGGVLGWQQWRANERLANEQRLARTRLEGEFQMAEALTEADPKRALGILAALATKAPSYPGLAKARTAANARVGELKIERLRSQASDLIEVARPHAERVTTLTEQVRVLMAPEAAPDPGLRELRLSKITGERESAYSIAVGILMNVIALLAEHPEAPEAIAARTLVARMARLRLEESERIGEWAQAERFAAEMRAAALPEHAAWLEGRGAITLETRPSDAEVIVYRYEDQGGRYVANRERSIGRTPIRDVPMAMGRYLLILKLAGHPDTRLPVFIERQEHERWPWPVPILTKAQIGEGYVYCPGGQFMHSGDKRAAYAGPLKRSQIGGLVVRPYEVTFGEYRAFLEGLLREGSDPALVQSHCPRRGLQQHYWAVENRAIRQRTPMPDAWPVFGVNVESAFAYAKWRGRQEGRPVKLLSEFEWERVARGADGRVFPWGEGYDPSYAVHEKWFGKGTPLDPQPVGSEKQDVSPFGVYDMAGSVSEWTRDRNPNGMQFFRGGAFLSGSPDTLRAAGRRSGNPTEVSDMVGFRVRASPKLE